MKNVHISKRDGKLYQKKESDKHCNAYTKGHYCKRPAGWGTSHPGEGRCKWHGGCAFGRPRKEGDPRTYIGLDILKKLEAEARLDPETIKKVDREIIILRKNFYDYYAQCTRENKLPDPNTWVAYTEALLKMIKIKAKTEKVKNEAQFPKLYTLYVETIISILKKCGVDEITLKAIMRDIKRIKLPQNKPR